ncbi:MAG: PorV/PorQ family protein [Calditrichaceae bacterium]
MKKTIYILFSLILSTAICPTLIAQIDNVGTSAGNFLKIGVGSRAQGMSGAYVAQADDATALYWNPAGIVHVQSKQVSFTQIDWIADIELNYLATAFSLGDFGHIGVGITYLSMGEMKITNWEHPEGTGETFNSNDLSIGLTYARHLTDRFNVGITVKYIQEKINQSTASAYAMDIGTSYNTGFHGIKIGMALTNFGTKMRMSGRDLNVRTDPYPTVGSNPEDVWANLQAEEWPLPIAIRIGTSVDLIQNEFMRFTGNFDFYDYRDVDQMWALGAETAFMNEQFFLRGGITPYIQDEIRLSLGAGVNYMFTDQYGITVDYAYSDLGILEKANRFSLALTF